MLTMSSLALLLQLATPPTASQPPILAFPESGLDDAASYKGYQTRFHRDGAKNTVQVYIDERASRIVHLWADAEDESIGFTVRTDGGRTPPIRWDGTGATITGGRGTRQRTLEHALIADATVLHLGWFLLGTMRVERDFQYEERQKAAFASPPYRLAELTRLIEALGTLDPETRRAHLASLRAPDVATLEARRRPSVSVRETAVEWMARVVQPSLDGRDTITLELRADPRLVSASRAGDSLTLRARSGTQVRFRVRIATTGAALSPLSREEIFTQDFLRFLAETKATAGDPASPAGLRARRMERQVRGVELLSSREKLMAGLPTYATYFGRDMLVSALMMRPIWQGAMSEAAISAALRKLGPTGEVSHEEALGGQAVREAAGEYADLIAARSRAVQRGEPGVADSLRRRAAEVLRDARVPRENYHMIDDELQLPVLVARWITDSSIPAARKRAFLRADGGRGTARQALLLRELAQVARMTAPYAESATAANLISFAPRDATWASSSWRDSGVGYAGGRYAMDVNAIWAPQALESLGAIVRSMRSLGVPVDSLIQADRTIALTPSMRVWARDSTALTAATDAWRGAWRHFLVTLSPDEVRAGITARLAAMPAEERTFWSARAAATGAARDSLAFLALSLDAAARPIAVVNTDPATRLFLGEREGQPMSTQPADMARTLRDVRLFARPYPAGLLVDRIGPVVANDAFAPPSVWSAFVKDPYHGPRVIWGREVNLFLLGAAERVRQGSERADPALVPYVLELRAAIESVRSAVTASGFHSELWSYGFTRGQIGAQRYGSGADVQLWSTTDLAVEYALAKMRK